MSDEATRAAYLTAQLYGKRVAIVGGAPAHESIEDYDFIVHTNDHWARIGGRVDAVYSGSPVPPSVEYPSLKYIAAQKCGHHFHAWKALAQRTETPLVVFDTRRYLAPHPEGPEQQWGNALAMELETKPFTGVAAIAHLLRFPIAELFVTGFTFYFDGERFPHRIEPHLVRPQMEWLARRAYCDRRIRLDGFLREHCTYQRPASPAYRVLRATREPVFTIWEVEEVEVTGGRSERSEAAAAAASGDLK